MRESWDPMERKRTGRDPPSCKEPREVMDRRLVLELVSSQESAMAPSRLVGGGSMVMVGMVGKEGREGREDMLVLDLLKSSCTMVGRVARPMVEEGVRGG